MPLEKLLEYYTEELNIARKNNYINVIPRLESLVNYLDTFIMLKKKLK